jgi:PTS system nitrogen regulatory IIA component
MNINDFLSPESVILDLRASDKAGLLRALAGRAAETLGISADRIASALLKREQLGSTGTGGGVAIPHARMPEVKQPYGMLVRLDKPLDFTAIDGQPVDLVFMLLLPVTPAGEQLTALANVARKLRDVPSTKSMRAAVNRSEIYNVMAGELSK